jgi:hypothetical protein
VVLPHGDDLVNDFYGGMALALALPDPLGVATTLGNEIVHVKHFDCF